MNFDFPDELKQLRDEARRFLTERCPTSVPRRILEGPEPYDRSLWIAMAEMGWTGAAIPEEFGGAGLGHLAVKNPERLASVAGVVLIGGGRGVPGQDRVAIHQPA